MSEIRQRVPFRFSEEGDQDNHILDEQEQEELIDRLRQASSSSNAIYLWGLQAVVGLSILLHGMYLFRSPRQSPFAVFSPNAPPEAPIPFATFLAFLQTAILCNLSLNLLPQSHPIRHALRTDALPFQLPLQSSHLVALLAPGVAPACALLLGQSWVDTLWWCTAGIVMALVAIVLRWMREEENEIAELENLRYTARGA
ncbi:hypothetical protein GY45DRAFT_1239731 [Cubamyces sp. BRFM 1775]|nr:hypothetical protein GY45DRAFT_1239731 [Cubamyces sp. BRFM 1775]